MAKNVLDLLMWHPKWDIEECVISYVHRGAQRNLKTINGSEISRLERGFIILKDGRSIPCHQMGEDHIMMQQFHLARNMRSG